MAHKINHEELSKQLHGIYGCGVLCKYIDEDEEPNYHYITQDLGELMSLASKNGISVHMNMDSSLTEAEWCLENGYINGTKEMFDRHNNPEEATCAAISNALIKKGLV